MPEQPRVTYRSKEEQTRAERARKLADTYRHVFGTPEGQAVLADILNDLHHFDCESTSQDVMALQKAARLILAKMQVIHPDNLGQIIQAYLTVPKPSKENK